MKQYQMDLGYLQTLSNLISCMDGESTVEDRNKCAEVAHLLLEATLEDDAHLIYRQEPEVTELELFQCQQAIGKEDMLDLNPMMTEQTQQEDGLFQMIGKEIAALLVGKGVNNDRS